MTGAYQQELQRLKEENAKLKDLHRLLSKLELHVKAAVAFEEVKKINNKESKRNAYI